MSIVSGLTRSKSERQPPPNAAALQKQIDDPSTGSIRRHWLRRLIDPRLRGGKAYGPSAFLPPEQRALAPPPMADSKDMIEHHECVARELDQLDRFAKQVDERIAALGARPDSEGLEHLRVKLRLLRSEIEHDLLAWPAAEASPNQRNYVKARTRELRELCWANSEKLRAAGEHRQADIALIDALRSRMCAEHEIGLRPHLSNY